MSDFNVNNYSADLHDVRHRESMLMRDRKPARNMLWAVLFFFAATFGFNGCGDVNNAPAPPIPPGALAIATSTLPSGSLGIFYDVTLAPSGGNAPYSWTLSSGSLPNGLNLASSGRISGTPTTVQTTNPTFRLQDSSVPTAAVVTKQLPMSITAVPQPTITTPSPLPNGIVNQPYPSTPLEAVGGTPPYTWSATVSPALPSGLTFNAATATISGTPTGTETNVTHTFSVTDSFSPTPQTVSKGLALTVSPAPLPLTITTGSLPPGTVTVPYPATTLAALGGTPPYTWSTVGNLAPAPGLLLSASGATAGQISGTPSTNVGSPFVRTYQVQDSAVSQQTAAKSLSITINLPAAPNITTTSLPNGNFNQSYNQPLGLSGGTAPFFWTFNGQLPPGLGLNSSTGVISGTATQTGTFDFTPHVVDATLQTDPSPPDLSITIVAPALSITTPSPLPIGTVNQPYPTTTLQATGGTPPYTWDPVVSPALPLTWTASTATISGIPLAGSEGTANHTFTVRDSTNPIQTVQKALSLTINAALTINESSLPAGTVGQAYTTALTASGGAPPYTWSIIDTGAPNQAAPGLTLSSGGVISGTPTTAVGSPFMRTYRVQDNNGVAVTKPLAITVNAALTIDNTSPLPAGKVGDPYGPVTLTASGGTPPYTWSTTTTPALPLGLLITPNIIPPDTATISGIPLDAENNVSHTFTVQDSTLLSVPKALSLTIDPP